MDLCYARLRTILFLLFGSCLIIFTSSAYGQAGPALPTPTPFPTMPVAAMPSPTATPDYVAFATEAFLIAEQQGMAAGNTNCEWLDTFLNWLVNESGLQINTGLSLACNIANLISNTGGPNSPTGVLQCALVATDFLQANQNACAPFL